MTITHSDKYKSFSAGFASAWTWGNVGEQLANGLISGAGSYVMKAFLDHIFDRGDKLPELLASFAADIAKELRQIIQQERVRQVKEIAEIVSDSYTKLLNAPSDKELIERVEKESASLVVKAKNLGVQGLAVYIIALEINLAALAHKAEQVDSGHYLNIIQEINEHKPILENLLAEAKAINKALLSPIHYSFDSGYTYTATWYFILAGQRYEKQAIHSGGSLESDALRFEADKLKAQKEITALHATKKLELTQQFRNNISNHVVPIFASLSKYSEIAHSKAQAANHSGIQPLAFFGLSRPAVIGNANHRAVDEERDNPLTIDGP